jgi:hypothetical protein
MSVNLERSFLALGLAYGALGMSLGIYMAATQDHGQMVTHAHLLLVGFLLSVIYAIIHRLWLNQPGKWLAGVQFIAHHLGVVTMVGGLFMLYGGHLPHESLEPVLASASISVLVALLLMLAMVIGLGSSATRSGRGAIDVTA